MALGNTGIETILNFLLEAVYASQVELVVAFMFVVGWRLGTAHNKNKKPQSYKISYTSDTRNHSGKRAGPGSQHMPRKGGKASNLDKDAKDAIGAWSNSTLLKNIQHLLSQVKQAAALVGDANTEASKAEAQTIRNRKDAAPKCQVLELYDAALAAGLELEKEQAQQCHELMSVLVTTAIRCGYPEAASALFRDLLQSGHGLDPALVTSTVKICTHKQYYRECLAIYELIKKDMESITIDSTVWSCLLLVQRAITAP